MYVDTYGTYAIRAATMPRSPGASAAAAPCPSDEARRRYVEIGELAALEQIRDDPARSTAGSLAVGPFARLDANAVAAPDGKTRGAHHQPVRQPGRVPGRDDGAGARRRRAASRGSSTRAGRASSDAERWVDAFFAGESARGPRTAASPTSTTRSSGRCG